MTDSVEQSDPGPTTKSLKGPIDAPSPEKFKQIVELHGKSGPFSIIIAQIDPDAIGSAFGMQEALQQLGYNSHIYYRGKVGHPQNDALCNKLGLMSRMKQLPTKLSVPREDNELAESGGEISSQVHLPNVVLVDSSKANDSRLPFVVSPVIVVDHHQKSDIVPSDDIFLWLDESSGSASTMVAELLQSITSEEWEPKPDLALMMALGIYTDCKSNCRTGPRDDNAYSYLKRYTNNTDLTALVQYKRPFSFLQHLARAVRYVEKYDTYRKGRILAGLGRIPEKCGDDLAMVADELLRTIGAPLALTWAVVEKKGKDAAHTIRVCARSEDYITNLAETLGNRFGPQSGAKTLPDGSAEGGALFELPMGHWFKEDEMEEIINRRIIEWFFETDDSIVSEED